AEMLEPHMTLDSDLGIDSIKRVEILSALQERLPGAPVVRPEELASLQTLGQIVEFLGGRGTGVSPVTDEEHERDAHATPRHGQDAHATAVLLEVVAEKTGYPSEMLELNMSLDSDLGIDSIKRVEIFAALRERLPGSPDVKAEDLGRLRTLGEVVDFLGQTVSAEVQTAAAGRESKPTTPDVESPADSKDVRPVAPLQRSVLTLKDLPQDGRSSIRIAPRSVFCLVGDDEALARDLAKELEKRGFPEPIVVSPTAAEEIRTTEWPANLGGLVLVASGDGVDDAFLKNSFRTLQAAAPALRQNAKENGGALFAAVSRIDGAFGLTAPATDREPLDGALAGLVKTAAHEWPEVACKAIDLAPNLSVEETARRLADEILLSGPVEVGLSASGTRTLSLETAPLVEVSPAAAKPPLAEGDVVVLSGGARGVTAEVAVAMGAAFRPTLVLLGRTPWPEVEPEWLACLTAESEIKKALAQQGGHGISPREIGERYRAIASAREIRSNLGRIEATGAKAIYRSVDVRDAEAVGRVLDEIREQHGPIKALIHGAGVLADRLIVEKTPEQFDRVYDTKVAGLRALLEASSDDPLSAIVLFSSSTGRFGRAGQSDYAMANEALNKFAQRESRRRPDCRVVSVNWGPWNGGMVTASLAKVFEQEGIGLIDLRAGADYLVREMSVPRSSDGAVEIVILGGTGVFPSLKGPDSPAAASPSPNEDLAPSFSLEVDVERFPFLRSHVMDGRAVVPMAMMVEWMAHGAMHTHPGLRFHGFNELRVLKGVILDGLASRSVRVFAGKAKKTDGVWTVHVEMRGGDARGHEIVYARCEVVLTSNLPPAPTSSASAPTSSASAPTSSASAPTSSASAPTSSAAAESDASSPVPRTFYEDGRLFHGPDLQGIDRLGAISPEGVAGRTKPCPPPAAWIRNPLRGRWLSDPLALDSAFQMMVLWTFERTGSCSLPCHARSFRQFQETPPDGARISIRVTRDTASAAWADIEFLDPRTDKVFARLDGYECVIDRSLNEAFRRNEIET
ncbi:SDR family NAD(P)-dependent oxidoreductase, partial [Candidatus Sumerlaeota bacterium]|nr:SDR family NAD(P)-dependent oxidoreductase [Candidatus Sumerlaeota bacterium]